MALLLNDVLDGVKHSRKHFLRHIAGLTAEQWTWKPYPECKSAAETLAHLVTDDRAFLQSLQTGREPDYAALEIAERDPEVLLELLLESHEELVAYIAGRYSQSPLDEPACAWGAVMPLAVAIGHLSSEDYYHAGQVAFIRMATDPGWDYYAAVYGGAD